MKIWRLGFFFALDILTIYLLHEFLFHMYNNNQILLQFHIFQKLYILIAHQQRDTYVVCFGHIFKMVLSTNTVPMLDCDHK